MGTTASDKCVRNYEKITFILYKWTKMTTFTRNYTEEEALELKLFANSITNWKTRFGEIDLTDWELIPEEDDLVYEYRGWEIIFNLIKLTATMKQYIDWDYQPVSRLIKKESESLEDFLKRAIELNENLWQTICFEDR